MVRASERSAGIIFFSALEMHSCHRPPAEKPDTFGWPTPLEEENQFAELEGTGRGRPPRAVRGCVAFSLVKLAKSGLVMIALSLSALLKWPLMKK